MPTNPSNSAYNATGTVPNGSGNPSVSTSRKNNAPKADIPTTAAADPSLKLPEALMQVDPGALSQTLPNMYKQFMQIRNLMNSFSTSNMNSSGNPNTSTPNIATSIQDVFTGALQIVSATVTYNTTLVVLFNLLGNSAYKSISSDYQSIVFNAITNLMKLALQNGELNIPVPTIPIVSYGTSVPSPIYSPSFVPNYYIQQYYTIELDPYPGYIQYLGPSGDYIYVKRSTTDYPYSSAQTEVHTTAQYAFAADLIPYFKNNNLSITILNTLLLQYCTSIITNESEKIMGKGSQQNLLSLLSQFAGIAATISNATQNNQLPQSVLNINSFSKTLNNHNMNIGKLKMLSSIASTSTIPAGFIVPGASNLLSLLSSGSTSSVSNIKSTIKGIIG